MIHLRALCFVMVSLLAACVRPASVLHVETEAVERASPTPAPPQAIPSQIQASTLISISQTPPPTPTQVFSSEYPVITIPLSGPITRSSSEISGMAWLDDQTLVLLPQYPEKFGEQASSGAVFAIQKSTILDYLRGETQDAIQPEVIPFDVAGLPKSIPGYEGFESIAISGNRVYLTIESRPGTMLGYLVSGQISSDLSRFSLEPSPLTPIPPQTGLNNFSDEALMVFGSRLVSIYEVNGAALNPHPVAHLFDFSLGLQDTLAFPAIEYRITDSTPADEFGRFWVINNFYPGDKELRPVTDPLLESFDEGASHAHSDAVERLIELQFSEAGIVLSESPPIQLELLSGEQSRNWEAISRLDEVGFLLASDRHPTTLLGFVRYP